MVRERWRAALLTAALLAATSAAGGIGGYVYSHEPRPDQLVVQVDRPLPVTPPGRFLAGVMLDALTVDAEGRSITLPAGVTVDELTRAEGGLPAGVAVNMGVDRTEFGQVLTGIVAVQETP